MSEEKKSVPIPSGAMYIGLCQSRIQYVALRWQKALAFMALNGVMGNTMYQVANVSQANATFKVAGISAVAVYLNFMWLRLTDRSNSWIAYYTKALEDMEKISGTESGVLVFGNEKYLSRPVSADEDTSTFRRLVRELSAFIGALWFLALVFSVLWGVYLAGQGGTWR
jgi:hypothetical protein